MSEKKKIQVHENDHIKVQYDPNICEHAAECVRGLPGVFDVKKSPWINIDNAKPGEIAEVIHRCPTGALTYELKGEAAVETEASGKPTEVTVIPNGPLRIAGPIVIRDSEGEVILEASKMSLCRCGHSANKPFCDGSHKKMEWKS